MKKQTVSAISSCALSLLALTASAQPNQRVTSNFKDADLKQVAEAVSAATGKNFIIDPRARAQVTMISASPMSPEAFYEAFLSILQVHGFIAVPAGDVIKILPDTNARQVPSVDLPNQVSATSDEIVTQVIDVKNVSAAQLVPILRPLVPQYGQLAAHPASNVLIVSDRANNVNRIANIVHRIDQVGDRDVEIAPLQHASATEVVRVVNTLYQQQANAEGALSSKIVADERSNSVLIGGDPAQRIRIRTLVALLDTPLDTGGESQVRYLQFADAEKLVPMLKEQITGIAQANSAGAGGGQAAASPQANAEKNALVWADPETNALVITAPPKLMRAIMSIVDKLDIRRLQVQVEAVIVEVNSDKTSDLGVNWAAWSEDGTIPLGGFISSVGGSSALDVYNAILGLSNGTSTSSSALTGTTLAIGAANANGINYGAIIRAVRGDASTNIVATPSAITMDNQEAEIKVAQEVPIVTGSYQTSSSSTSSNPFTTVQREEVGTILKVTPQIAAEGTSVVLKISIESSSVATTSVSDVDITTNKRTVSTSVLVDDGGIVVLGGLIQDNAIKSEQGVPLLASIPILGLAFKTRNNQRTKNNLMIFIRPKILKDARQAAFVTGTKYNYMLNEQRKADKRELLPLLREKAPQLEPLPAPPPSEPSETTAPAPRR